MIPIFDSLCHPTISGNWLEKPLVSKFDKLAKDLERFGFIGAAAVGIDGLESYNHNDFIENCNLSKLFYPVAGFNINTNEVEKEMGLVMKLGFKAIKIHPRFSNLDYEVNEIKKIFNIAHKNGIVVFYCTYHHSTIQKYPSVDPFHFLIENLKEVPDLKLILLHGGDIDILKYAELVRFNENLLLDLSMTIFKYEGSSIDKDIDFLFKKFDKRICIGSDHPEHSHQKLRQFFEKKSDSIDRSKLENIAYKNIMRFLNLDFI